MYKKKLRRWQVRKNYSQQQKREAIEFLTADSSKGQAQSRELTINQKPLKAARLLRSFPKGGHPVSFPPLNPTKKMNVLQSTPIVHTVRQKCSPWHANTTTIHSPGGMVTESALQAIRQYYSWHTSQTQIERLYDFPEELIDTINLLIDARACLHKQTPRAFLTLDRFCSRLRPLLIAQPFHLLGELVSEFVREKWQRHQRLRSSLLGFLRSLAS